MKIYFGLMFVLWSVGAAAEEIPKGARVFGECLRSVQPDRGSLTAVAQVTKNDLASAAKTARDQYERFRQKVEALRLKDLEIQTSEYNLQELKEYENNKTVFKGFRARIGAWITTSDTQRLGEVIAIATKENLRDVGGLNTFLSPERLRKEREICLDEAVRNAKKKAEAMAKAAGKRVGALIYVEEQPEEQVIRNHPVMMDAMMAKGGAEMAPPTISTADQNLSIKVIANFSLE